MLQATVKPRTLGLRLTISCSLLLATALQFNVIRLVQLFTGRTIPTWFAWTLVALTWIGLISSALTGWGFVVIPGALKSGILGLYHAAA